MCPLFFQVKIISSDILKTTKNSNCQEDGSISLPISLKNTGNIHIIEYLKLEHSNSDSEDDSELLEDINLCETQVKRYVSGYTIYKSAVQKTECCRCVDQMKKDDKLSSESELLIKIKISVNSLNLINPSDNIFEIFSFQMKCYKVAFNKFASRQNIKKKISEYIIENTNEQFNWFDANDVCFKHRLEYLEFTLNTLIYKNSKWLSEILLTAKKNKKKLKKLNTRTVNL